MKRAMMLLSLALASAPLLAGHTEARREAGGYVVRCEAVSTTALSAETAWRFGVQRAGNTGVVNIHVEERGGAPVQAALQVVAQNDKGEQQRVAMRRIADNGDIYYVGEFEVSDRERLQFQVSVRPPAAKEALEVAFARDFFVLDEGATPVARR